MITGKMTLILKNLKRENKMTENNPLLKEFTEPFGTIPFNELKTEHFVPALDAAIDEAKAEMDVVANNQDNPTFENTILAMELSGKKIGRVASAYFHLFGSESDKDFQALAEEISPKLAKFGNDINLNKDLFKRVEDIHENQIDSLNTRQFKHLEYLFYYTNGLGQSEIIYTSYYKILNSCANEDPHFEYIDQLPLLLI